MQSKPYRLGATFSYPVKYTNLYLIKDAEPLTFFTSLCFNSITQKCVTQKWMISKTVKKAKEDNFA
jgi:hypothetical protein